MKTIVIFIIALLISLTVIGQKKAVFILALNDADVKKEFQKSATYLRSNGWIVVEFYKGYTGPANRGQIFNCSWKNIKTNGQNADLMFYFGHGQIDHLGLGEPLILSIDARINKTSFFENIKLADNAIVVWKACYTTGITASDKGVEPTYEVMKQRIKIYADAFKKYNYIAYSSVYSDYDVVKAINTNKSMTDIYNVLVKKFDFLKTESVVFDNINITYVKSKKSLNDTAQMGIVMRSK